MTLTPTGFHDAAIFGLGGNQQAGNGYTAANVPHALVWSGTAASAVDLSPTGFDQSQAIGLDGSEQVGFAQNGQVSAYGHAFLWTGTAASAVDLNAFLPTNYASGIAVGIDANGNIGGYAYDPTAQNEDAVL